MENFREPLRLPILKLVSPSHSSRDPEIITECSHWDADDVKYLEWFLAR